MAKASKTATPFDLMNGMAPEAVRENMDRFMSFAGEMTELSREGISAATQASAKGAQEINTRAMAFFQDAMATGMEASKSVTAAKSLQEAMELQAGFAKSAFEVYMRQFGEMASLYAATLKEASAPLNAHAGTVVEKMQLVK